ncbi:beta-lactamase family protein, partial [Streptomyces sp. SID10692]|uniref:serine hydrolase n=1 Tax=Streptomyces sp. SID10692 TaxID=2706026 RepID=UPI0013DC9C92|nr:beta-lactamase family protein [Streptomyces sp. SID10692]
RVRPGPEGTEAVGHRRDGTPVPALDTGGFTAAGAVRATPLDMLTFLEAHTAGAGLGGPESTGPGLTGPTLAAALAEVRRPVLRRGLRHTHTHTLTWFHHPSPYGPVLFHAGATLGQQAFLGFRPDSGLAVAATATRRVHRADTFVATAYGLLTETP